MAATPPPISLAVLYPAKWSKFASDTNISPALLAAFQMTLQGSANDGELMDRATHFCRTHQMHGPDVGVPEFVVGRVCAQISFEELLNKHLRLRPEDTRQLLAQLVGETPVKRIATIKAVLGGTPMGNYLLWVFRNPADGTNPFAGSSALHLPCRLGLTYTVGESHLAWGIAMPAGHPLHVPTAFDAGVAYIDKWAPGGATVPEGACEEIGLSGLPEFVLRPIPFEHMTTDLLQFSAL